MFGCCSDGTDQETAKRLRDEQTLEGSFEENGRLQNHVLALEHTLLELIREKEKLKLENVSFTEKVVTLYKEKSEFEFAINERDELIKTLREESKFRERSQANDTASRDMTTNFADLQARYDQFEKDQQQYLSQQQLYQSRITEQTQIIASLQEQLSEKDRVIASFSDVNTQQSLNKMDHLRAFFTPSSNPPKSPGRPKSSRSPR